MKVTEWETTMDKMDTKELVAVIDSIDNMPEVIKTEFVGLTAVGIIAKTTLRQKLPAQIGYKDFLALSLFDKLSLISRFYPIMDKYTKADFCTAVMDRQKLTDRQVGMAETISTQPENFIIGAEVVI